MPEEHLQKEAFAVTVKASVAIIFRGLHGRLEDSAFWRNLIMSEWTRSV